MSRALGLVEVRGYVAAVEAADSALKAANVTLIGLEKIKGGITTIKITGDVGAITAAVDAAKASVEGLGTFRTAHIIPRIDLQVQDLFFEKHKNSQESSTVSSDENNISKDDEKVEEPKVKIVEPVKEKSESKEETKEIEPQSKKIEESMKNNSKEHIDYSSMKVEELRRLVRTLRIPNMTNKQIKFAKKDVLIKAILEYNEAGEE